ncbi:unnamed protein product [Rhodiola kirilowii]
MATTAASIAFSLPWNLRLRRISMMMAAKASSRSDRHCVRKLFCSGNSEGGNVEIDSREEPKGGPVKSGLYLVGTPIGNLEDITLRALRVLKAADVILSEDTRHSGKLLQHYNIKTPLLSYHKFNEFQRERSVMRRLQEGEIVALIKVPSRNMNACVSCMIVFGVLTESLTIASQAVSLMAKLCVDKNIPVTPIPGPSAVIAALSASGLPTDQFTFVGFLPKHTTSRRDRLTVSANEAATQIFFVPPHKLLQFLEETYEVFSPTRRCVIAREMTKMHEEFWREGKAPSIAEGPTESQLESQLGDLISKGHSLSMAVKIVAEGTSSKRKTVYSFALKKFGKQAEEDD